VTYSKKTSKNAKNLQGLKALKSPISSGILAERRGFEVG
jgi:hypothetical protein